MEARDRRNERDPKDEQRAKAAAADVAVAATTPIGAQKAL
jgi:hypothetical protein